MPVNYRIADIFKHYTEDEHGCWIWKGGAGSEGYGYIRRANIHGTAHRVFYEHFVGPIPDGLCVLHRCDVRLCVNPSHLWLGTNKDNVDDREAKGRNKLPISGEFHHKAKLNAEKVIDIKKRFSSGESKSAIARSYGLHFSSVDAIIRGKNWSNVSPKPEDVK